MVGGDIGGGDMALGARVSLTRIAISGAARAPRRRDCA